MHEIMYVLCIHMHVSVCVCVCVCVCVSTIQGGFSHLFHLVCLCQ